MVGDIKTVAVLTMTFNPVKVFWMKLLPGLVASINTTTNNRYLNCHPNSKTGPRRDQWCYSFGLLDVICCT